MNSSAIEHPLTWLATASSAERKALLAGGLGWLLDAFDVMLYSMVLTHLIQHFGMKTATAGFLHSLTLVASAVGGVLFGFFADRVGRTRALMASILVYSLTSGASGLAQTIVQLGIFRFLLGLGMGGEWATGAALVAETWRTEHRGKALALMQSSWAIGEVLAALVTGAVLSVGTFTLGGDWVIPAWRVVFFVGVLPALVVFWIRRGVPEPAIWRTRAEPTRVPLRRLWAPGIRWHGLVATLMNTAALFAYWGLFLWIPPYLALSIEQGGRGLGLLQTTLWLVVMGASKWLGYVLFGYFADRAGRKKTYMGYLMAAAVFVALFGTATHPALLLVLGVLTAFFGTGHFSGFGAIASELFPTEIRGTAMGLSYNLGRAFSALAPYSVGALASFHGLGFAFGITSGAFLLAAALAALLPETKGQQLP